MKTRTITYLSLTFILTGFLLSSCEKEELVDLIVNGNVEKGMTYPDDWWSNDGDDKYNTKWNPLEYYSPKRSIVISTKTADSINIAYWGQSIKDNLPIGQVVTLKVKIKAALDGEGASIVIRGDDNYSLYSRAEQFVTTQGESPIIGTFDWTEYSITLDNVDATTIMLTVYLVYLPNTTGEVYFDDISLTYWRDK